MQVIVKGRMHLGVQNATPEEIKGLMEFAGNKIGSVHFIKRSTGELRKMCYRLHVQAPSHANAPKSSKIKFDGQFHRDESGRFAISKNKLIASRKRLNEANDQITVFDVNKVTDEARGAWRTVPLDQVKRIVADGVTYDIESINN